MKVTVAKSDLESALAITSNTVAASGDNINADFIFRHVDGEIEVLSYNESFFSGSPMICRVEGLDDDNRHNQFTIESKRLRRWVGAVDDSALVFEHHRGVVKATSPRGSVKFRSKDPTSFPFWDKTLEEAKTTAKIQSSDLAAALGYAKHFVSKNETMEPHLCNCQFRGGALLATDGASCVRVTVPGMEESSLRVPGREIGKSCKFLDVVGCEVEIYEHSRGFFLRSPDGRLFGSERQGKDFPKMGRVASAFSNAHQKWTFDKSEMLTALDILSSSANYEDNWRRSTYRVEGSFIEMSLVSATGDTVSLSVPLLELEENTAEGTLPDKGFTLNYEYLTKIVSQYSGDRVVMGVSSQNKGGWVSFCEEIGDSKRLTVLSWVSAKAG